MEAVAHLTAAKDRNGKFLGYYKCSLCDAEFRPNPSNLGELSKTFAAHVQFSHSAKQTQDKELGAGTTRRQMYRKRI